MNATSQHRSEGIRLVLVSGLFVAVGIALGDRVPWYATAFFAVCLLLGVLWIFGYPKYKITSIDQLTIDEAGITRTAKGLREHVAWGNIARVRIMTTDQGPQLEDVYFAIDSTKGDGCLVAHDLAVRSGLLEALQARLDGLNNGAVIEAMTSSENRTFTIWEAPANT